MHDARAGGSTSPTSGTTLPPDSPFLRQDGLRQGLSKHCLDGPSFVRVFGSVRLAAHAGLTPLNRARAALLVVPTGIVSHHTAAALWGGVVPETSTTHVTVTSAKQRRTREGLRCHVRPRPGCTRRHGLRVTTPAQTFVDLAEHLALVDLVVLGDSLLHKGATRLEDLLDAAAAASGRGAAAARAAADLVRGGAESPMETRVRVMLHLAGLPEPRLQWEVADGTRRFRLDLAWPELRLAVEYDGRQHAESTTQWGRDLGRREWLDARGWRVIVLRSGDVYDDPWSAVARVVEAMASRGYVKPLRTPPPRFVEHFPGRTSRRPARS